MSGLLEEERGRKRSAVRRARAPGRAVSSRPFGRRWFRQDCSSKGPQIQLLL